MVTRTWVCPACDIPVPTKPDGSCPRCNTMCIRRYEILEDSGDRIDYGTGAVRDVETGKGRFDLIPYDPLRRLAIHYENGANKYQERNWEKGIPVSRCFSSAIRHLFRWLAGSRSEDHLAAAAWNIFAIMHFEQHMPEMLDVPGGEDDGDSDNSTD